MLSNLEGDNNAADAGAAATGASASVGTDANGAA